MNGVGLSLHLPRKCKIICIQSCYGVVSTAGTVQIYQKSSGIYYQYFLQAKKAYDQILEVMLQQGVTC